MLSTFGMNSGVNDKLAAMKRPSTGLCFDGMDCHALQRVLPQSWEWISELGTAVESTFDK